MGRTTAGVCGHSSRFQSDRRATARLSERPRGEVVDTRKMDIYFASAEDQRRQIRQESLTRPTRTRRTGHCAGRVKQSAIGYACACRICGSPVCKLSESGFNVRSQSMLCYFLSEVG